jgi:coenzyme F420-0:L-glutamate ligase/coenzyme F420-1:gamma-L-glutamate ligase
VITIRPVEGLPEIEEGDDLAELLLAALDRSDGALEDGDVLVVTQKVVSKAEGRLLPRSERGAAIEAGSRRVLRRSGEMTISETHHGFVCANAGVDESNVREGYIALLPEDPDASARRIRSRLSHLAGHDIAVVISDTFGRAWRLGQTDVAIGVAGFDPFVDHVGSRDTQGRTLTATRICIADELAGAAEMVMGKADGICAALIRGAAVRSARATARMIVRPARDDLFR